MKSKLTRLSIWIISTTCLAMILAVQSQAQDANSDSNAAQPVAIPSGKTSSAKTSKSAPPTAAPDEDESGAAQVNVDKIKEKYWARGDESEIGVVQNRTYSKVHRWEISLYGGVVSSDPFLSIENIGGSVGYHFSEYFSAHLLAFKDYASNSSASTAFSDSVQTTLGTRPDPNTNKPSYFVGGEARWSLLYGKLSLVGKAIIYYDLHVLGGLGITDTQTGNDLTPYIGLGQQIYLTKNVTFNVDYRLMGYEEHLVNNVDPAHLGQQIGGNRINYSNVIDVGFSFLFGGDNPR